MGEWIYRSLSQGHRFLGLLKMGFLGLCPQPSLGQCRLHLSVTEGPLLVVLPGASIHRLGQCSALGEVVQVSRMQAFP